MMKVVVDTNCLLSSINRNSIEYEIYKAFDNQLFTWVVSTEILNEYYEIISNFYSPQTADLVLGILTTSRNIEFAEPYFRWNLVENDPDDNKFADLAISVNANYLVSNDKHFKFFKKLKFPRLEVVKSKEFIRLLSQEISSP
jgi:uncharacterized protein